MLNESGCDGDWRTDDEMVHSQGLYETPTVMNGEKGDDSGLVTLLPYEKLLMMDTFSEHVLFIAARGLGLERLFLHHLHLYNEPRYTVFVLNTRDEDEHYFLEQLSALNRKAPPKLLNYGAPAKDRETLYKTGGIQFITERVLMVDLLTDRVPIDMVAGIIIYRAHELLIGYQASFILRLFLEKKRNSACGGFIKAFTDDPTRITSYGLGQLQHLVERLYVKRVILLPRFDAAVKEYFNEHPAKFMQISLSLNPQQKKIRSSLVDLINTCARELKQCTHSMSEANPSAGKSTTSSGHTPASSPPSNLSVTPLENELRSKTLLLTDKQERLMRDLRLLRVLLRKVENLDPTRVWEFVEQLRANKEIVENNSGWIFTPTAAVVFSGVEALCSSKDAQGHSTISAPPKWYSFKLLLEEIARELVSANSESPVLVVAEDEETSRQLVDLVKFGPDKYCWLLTKAFASNSADGLGPQPRINSIWNPHNVSLYDTLDGEKDRVELVSQIQEEQKKVGREKGKHRRKRAQPPDPNQPTLVNFIRRKEQRRSKRLKISEEKNDTDEATKEDSLLSISDEIVPEGMEPEDPLTNHYAKQNGEGSAAEQSSRDREEKMEESVNGDGSVDADAAESTEKSGWAMEDWCTMCKAPLIFLTLGNRYNLLKCLGKLGPNHVILHNTDLISTRIIETFKASNPDHKLSVHCLIYGETTEEERYLSSIQREQFAFEALIRDQGVLAVPQDYDVNRESVSELRKLALCRDSRLAPRVAANASSEDGSELRASIISDLREFNAELPTVLYRRGIDLVPTTLEIGDYVLSNEICVERKALDDLVQSLWSGRVFKQIEQTLRYYSKTVLLVESNEKFRQKRTLHGGPFQGELSRRSRETRSLFAMLIRAYPKMRVIWSMSPPQSAELFEEIKLDQPNADIEEVTSHRSEFIFDDEGNNGESGHASDREDFARKSNKTSAKKLDPLLRRRMTALPGLSSVLEVEKVMRGGPSATTTTTGHSSAPADPGGVTTREDGSAPANLRQLAQCSAEQMTRMLGNGAKAQQLLSFFSTDFRLLHM